MAKQMVIIGKEEDIDLILETIAMDANSSAFDQELRARIGKVIKNILVGDVPDGYCIRMRRKDERDENRRQNYSEVRL